MRSCSSFSLSALILFLALPSLLWAQSSTESRVKVCVAMVNNRAARSLYVERLTERLAHDLNDSKLSGIVMDSTTTSDRDLHPTLQNSEELKSRECDYLVLTQVTDPKSHPAEMGIPPISIGGKAPSVDASDPMGGQSGPQHRDNLEVNFAVFRPGSPKSVMNARVLDQPSGNVSDSMMPAMDREANRIAPELKKK